MSLTADMSRLVEAERLPAIQNSAHFCWRLGVEESLSVLFARRQEIIDAREALDPRLSFAGNQQAALEGAIDFEPVAFAGGDARQRGEHHRRGVGLGYERRHRYDRRRCGCLFGERSYVPYGFRIAIGKELRRAVAPHCVVRAEHQTLRPPERVITPRRGGKRF